MKQWVLIDPWPLCTIVLVCVSYLQDKETSTPDEVILRRVMKLKIYCSEQHSLRCVHILTFGVSDETWLVRSLERAQSSKTLRLNNVL